MLACALGGLEGLHACAAPGQMHAARPARCLRCAGPSMQIGAELGNGELTYPFGLAQRVGRDTFSDEWEEEEAYTPQVCHSQASNPRRADATDRSATHTCEPCLAAANPNPDPPRSPRPNPDPTLAPTLTLSAVGDGAPTHPELEQRSLPSRAARAADADRTDAMGELHHTRLVPVPAVGAADGALAVGV